MGAIQFIHISDVNIGRKSDKLLFGQTGEKDRITTLKQVVSDAGKLQADFVFITGDLFDHPATEEDLAWIDERVHLRAILSGQIFMWQVAASIGIRFRQALQYME